MEEKYRLNEVEVKYISVAIQKAMQSVVITKEILSQ